MGQNGQVTQIDVPGFEILEPIGRGGMGRVFLARQTSLGRLVAIKFLTFNPNSDPLEQAARFRREAEITARVNHPHIVSVHDYGDVGGQPYLVMEYFERGDLRQIMVPGKPMPAHRVKGLIVAIAQALAHLHSQGILHRDLKPENILISSDSVPKVTDFGIAVHEEAIGTLTRQGDWNGTLGYAAPEQQYRLKVDERADQYSLAAVAYELLTGQMPLGRFKTPSELNPLLSSNVDSVLRQALQDDADDRYPAILDFADALEAALEPISTEERSWPQRAALALGLLAVCVVAALGIRYALDRGTGDRGPATPQEPRPEKLRRSFENSLGMKMVLIPAGEFLMGSSNSDSTASPEELPQHAVKITRPFYMDAHEVTLGQFRAFVKATGYVTDAEKDGKGGYIYDFRRNMVVQDPRFTWSHPGYPEPFHEDDPVVQVSWNDAVEFCAWLSRKEGRVYRLPTEAEWEYACRGGNQARWSFGNDVAKLNTHAWTFTNSDGRPHAVGRKAPNAFQLSDMHGNVWEWCLDRFARYESEPAVDPSGLGVGPDRVLRGGAWDWEQVEKTRSASRMDSRPSYCYFTYGFRVCHPVP